MSDIGAIESDEDIQDVVSEVYHELNNPLSIIAGNAQFLAELSKEEGLDEQFVSSARDIEEASRQMSESLRLLKRLKEQLPGDSS
jgi:nitrogen-specific signal transduction histidine kinase